MSPINEDKRSDNDSINSDDKQLVEMDILGETIAKEIHKKNRAIQMADRAKTQSDFALAQNTPQENLISAAFTNQHGDEIERSKTSSFIVDKKKQVKEQQSSSDEADHVREPRSDKTSKLSGFSKKSDDKLSTKKLS